MKDVGPLYKAIAPSYFTFASHAAMFVGFTPGIAKLRRQYLNPKFGKIFRLEAAGFAGKRTDGIRLFGENIIAGFANRGYVTIGTGAVGWFNPKTPTGRVLGRPFQHFFFPGNTYSLDRQIEWIGQRLRTARRPVFLFLNVGETHIPYYFKGAPWDPIDNPCVPFQAVNRARECKARQKACLEFVDRAIADLLERFRSASVLICADHGDCWGEDGLWEHGISHEMTLTVPMVMHFSKLLGSI